MDDILSLAYTSVQAILEITCICSFGAILMWKGFISRDLHKGLSRLNVKFFTPCLLFTKMASNATLETYINMWPIPIIFFIVFVLSLVISTVGSKIMGFSNSKNYFVKLCTIFSNSNSLPISLFQSIAISSASYLQWNEKDSSESIQARGITYIMVFAAVSNIIRWSYGIKLINSITENELSFTSTESGYESDDSKVELLNEDSDCISETQPANISLVMKLKLFKFIKTIKNILNPPLIAIFLAFCVSIIPPLKSLLYGSNPILGPISHAISVCSGAAIPSILIGLGCNLYTLMKDYRKVSLRMVSLVIISRFIIVPAITISLLLVARPYFYLGSDPAFLLVMMILIASPTAINLLQVCQSVNKFEDEITMVLLYSYIIAIPTMTMSVTCFLYVIKLIPYNHLQS